MLNVRQKWDNALNPAAMPMQRWFYNVDLALFFFCENPSIHALLFQISRFQFISQFVVQIVDLELKYFTIKKYFVKYSRNILQSIRLTFVSRTQKYAVK